MSEETKMSDSTRETVRNFILAMIHREAEFEPKPDLEKILNDFDKFLARMSNLIRTGVLALIKSLEMSTLAQGYRHTFSKLSPREQKEYLYKMEQSSNYAFRGMVMGIKAMIFLIYFSTPEAQNAVGYDGKCLLEEKSSAKLEQKKENLVPEDFFYH